MKDSELKIIASLASNQEDWWGFKKQGSNLDLLTLLDLVCVKLM